MSREFDDDDDYENETEPGGVRDTDPPSSHKAAGDGKAIGTLYKQTLEAMAYADKYPMGGMTSFDVARHYGRDNARDSYSPSVYKLNEQGITVFVAERPCENAAGDMEPMNCYRLRRPNDPEGILRPPRGTRVQRMLNMWRKATREERADFMAECEEPVLADYAWGLWKRMVPGERAMLQDWINNGP